MSPEVEQITAHPDWYAPYNISLGIRTENLIFISGQAAVNEDGEFVGKDNFNEQAEQVFKNLSRILANAGSSLENVVKVTIFLTDMSHFEKVVDLREQYFSAPYPADSILEVNSLARPEWLIEIEAVAVTED